MLATVPEGWTVAIGDRTGSYVARSKQHEEMTGKPGLPEYVAKVVGRAGTFKSVNFQGTTLLAGYYRSPSSGWFYTANVPMSVVQAPLWRSLSAIGAIGLLAMAVSSALTYFVGKGFTRAAGDLRDRAAALGEGRPVQPMQTNVSEFAVISEALMTAERDLSDRASELRTVLETVPAAVWFTYDPGAREVIRNRFAADLMGLPTETRKSFGSPDQVIDTVAIREGHTVSREDRPLSRAMRGEQTDNEEFAYILPSGIERILLSSARPILDAKGGIIGAVQISLDITERKRGEEQRKLLVNELNHRVKNTLAVVQSIASQTMRTATDLNEAGTSLSGRLLSLAKAHDILTQESWSGADLEGIVASSIAAQEDPARVELSGPMVRLPPNLALSLALVIHELTTNAIKYGALSNESGRVLVGWTLDSGPTTHRIRVEWREIGGPQVALPERKGFGTRMFERIFDRGSEGNISMAFGERGLVCTIELEVPYSAVDAPGANG
jgi:two-component sensor histidine kinase/PAS domain-containing protein